MARGAVWPRVTPGGSAPGTPSLSDVHEGELEFHPEAGALMQTAPSRQARFQPGLCGAESLSKQPQMATCDFIHSRELQALEPERQLTPFQSHLFRQLETDPRTYGGVDEADVRRRNPGRRPSQQRGPQARARGGRPGRKVARGPGVRLTSRAQRGALATGGWARGCQSSLLLRV